MTSRPTGLTTDAGGQIGVSRTLPVGCDAAWDYLLSATGLAVWLGEGLPVPLEKGLTYRTTAERAGRSVASVAWRPR